MKTKTGLIILGLIAGQNAYAVDQTLNIQSADSYWQRRAEHNTTTAVDNYSQAHPQNIRDAGAAGYQLGTGARSNYNKNTLNTGLNAHQSGNGGLMDMNGQNASNTKTTNYDLCLLNNPRNPTACDSDKAASDAYKLCKRNHPDTFLTDCANVAGAALATMDFKQRCQNSRPYIRVNYIPSASTFDINTLMIGVDPRLSGSTQIIQPLAGQAISGVCNNGVISCDPGTWDNCGKYKWVDAGGGVPGLQSVLTDLAGCYCINASCGSNLPLLNGSQILRDLSMGAVAAIMNSQGEGVQITDTHPDFANLQISMDAALLADCSGTGTGSSPNVNTGNPNVNNLLGVGQSITNGNYNNDYLQDAGANSAVSAEAQPDAQGGDISASGFSDPAVRAQWRANYQTNGNNYYKMVKNTDDITSMSNQELSCNIRRNFTVTQNTIDITGNNTNVICANTNAHAILTQNTTTHNYEIKLKGSGGTDQHWCDSPTIPGGNAICLDGVIYNCSGSETQTAHWYDTTPTWSDSNGNTVDCTPVGCVSGPNLPLILWQINIFDNWMLSKTIMIPTMTPSGTVTTTTGSGTTTSSTSNTVQSSGFVLKDISADFNLTGEGCTTMSGHISSVDTETLMAACTTGGMQTPKVVYNYDLKFVEDVKTEGISDGCQILDTDSSCRMKDESIDGIRTTTGYMATGLSALPSCLTRTGIVAGPYTECRPWWTKTRTYLCNRPVTQNADVADIDRRATSVTNSTQYDATSGATTFNDSARNSSGDWTTTARQTSLNVSTQTPGGCDMVCKASVFVADTQVSGSYGSTVNTTNPNAPQRTGVNTTPPSAVGGTPTSTPSQPGMHKEYSYKFCNPTDYRNMTTNASDWTCPLSPEETRESDCGCPDSFGEAVGRVNTLVTAAHDTVCTDGVPQ